MQLVGAYKKPKAFIAIAVTLSCLAVVANGWCLSTRTSTAAFGRSPHAQERKRRSAVILSLSANTEDVATMRLSEIKSELQDRKIDFSDCFDKESMVQKLTEARANNIDHSSKNDEAETSEKDEADDASTPASPPSSSPTAFDREAALEELQGMRVRELREELGRRRISRAGLFEKEDLVRALLKAREVASVFSGTGLLTPGEVSMLSETDVQTEMDHHGNTYMLLDVYATWCGPCQMIAPILEQVAQEKGDQLRVVKMDSDQNPALSTKLKVQGLPTLVLFKDGEEVDRLEGAPTKDQLVAWIDAKTC